MFNYHYLKYYALLIIFVSSQVCAHPHSFITLKTEFVVQNDKLTQLDYTWTMDELTSSYLQLEYIKNPKQTLDDLMNNIVENHLFSVLSVNTDHTNQTITLTPLKQDSTLHFNNNKAILDFSSQLQEPISISHHQFELTTYEKTFYVDMYYEQDSDVSINNANCKITIDKPTPDDSTLNYAQALDEDQQPIQTDDFILGKLFAQKVVITCN